MLFRSLVHEAVGVDLDGRERVVVHREGVVDWLDVDHAFPMHYDTFPPIEVRTERFVNEVAGTGSDAEVHVLDGDEAFEL